MFYPMLMKPVLHVRVWGSDKLSTVLGKTLPDSQPYGESWEVHDTSVVANGAFAGSTVGSLIAEYGELIIGAGNPVNEGMPLLLKFLDASQWLSIQVHPNGEQARQLEDNPRGKNEAWIILEAQPNSQIVVGIKDGTTREQAQHAIANGTLEDFVLLYQPHKGDTFYMPANTIHALGPGLLVYEIQESSDITYRLYDWNRMGVDGKPRALHVEKGLQVADLNVTIQPSHTPEGDGIVLDTPYFVTTQHVNPSQSISTHGRFQLLTCIEGTITVSVEDQALTLEKGQTAFLAAAISTFMLQGEGVLLRSCQP